MFYLWFHRYKEGKSRLMVKYPWIGRQLKALVGLFDLMYILSSPKLYSRFPLGYCIYADYYVSTVFNKDIYGCRVYDMELVDHNH